MLLPALNRAKESARKIECLNNLKQIYLASSNYIDSQKEYIVPALYGSIWGILLDKTDSWGKQTYLQQPNVTGTISRYTLKIMACPSEKRPAFSEYLYPYLSVATSYHYGINAFHSPIMAVAPYDKFQKIKQVDHPSQVFHFMDGIYERNARPYVERGRWDKTDAAGILVSFQWEQDTMARQMSHISTVMQAASTSFRGVRKDSSIRATRADNQFTIISKWKISV